MTTPISARFYHVIPDKKAQSFVDALEAIEALGSPVKRAKTIGNNVRLRLERLEEIKGKYLAGEITRVEKDNLPSEVLDNEVKKLSIKNPLGFSVAFAYRKSDGRLAMQHNLDICGPSRFRSYIQEHKSDNKFIFNQLITNDAWSKFDSGEATRLKVRIASPASFDDLDDESNPLTTSIKRMGKAYHAPFITIEMSVGHKKGSLSDNLKEVFKSMVKNKEVEWARAKVLGTEEEIDLTNYLLKENSSLDLTDLDPTISYTKRRDFVLGALAGVKGG